ncbi:hypothetical protein P3T20_005065 [Paraburkholderia sp. GAS206C]|uniref:hypothetical protein n=1 Tax=unclassified Paraburkholderia TaxID=2615204 RepID=UPI003D1BFC4A
MTKPCGTPEHQHLLDAASSILRRIQSRATEINPGITTADLESALCINPRSDTSRRGATFEKYRDCGWKGVPATLVQTIRRAAAKNWLTLEDLQELGFWDEALFNKQPADIFKIRWDILTLFIDGVNHMKDGYPPMPELGSGGNEILEGLSDDKMAQAFQGWIAKIRCLGGEIRYLPYVRRPTTQDKNLLDDFEFVPRGGGWWAYELECREQRFADHEATADVFVPDYHPSKVVNLRLWVGGRDYSALPYSLLDEGEFSAFWTPNQSAPFTQGIGSAEDSRIRARVLKRKITVAKNNAKKRSLLNLAKPNRLTYWPDLSMYGARLKIARLPDNTVHLVLIGIEAGTAEAQGLEPLGFVPSVSGRTLVRQGADLLAGTLFKVFPDMTVREIPASKAWMRIKAPLSAPVAMEHPLVESGKASDQSINLEPPTENFAMKVSRYGKDAQGRDAVFGIRLDTNEEVTVVLRPDPHPGKRLHPRPEVKDFAAEIGEVSMLFERLSSWHSSSLRQSS